MTYYREIDQPAMGSFVIAKEKEIKGGFSDQTYLFVYSDLFNSYGDWLYVCQIEEFSKARFLELTKSSGKRFELVEIDAIKYITVGRCMLDYPEGVILLMAEEPENQAG